VKKQQKTEEELRKSIFDTYSQLREESSSDRRQVYFPQLRDKIINWSIGYFYKEKTNDYWLEITNAIFRIVNAEDTRKMPENEHDFLKYLSVSLYNAKIEYFREYEEEDNIHIPKGKKQKLKEITEFIRMEESELGRELSEYEKVERTSLWFNMPEDKAREYLEQIIHLGKTLKDTDILDSSKKHSDSPEKIYISNLKTMEDKEKLREALESVFADRLEKTRPFYRALFTAQCLDIPDDSEYRDKTDNIEWLNDNFEYLREYLDSEIMETFKKTREVPTNREIYTKFYPDSNSPDASVSARLREFRDDLKAALEEKGLKFPRLL